MAPATNGRTRKKLPEDGKIYRYSNEGSRDRDDPVRFTNEPYINTKTALHFAVLFLRFAFQRFQHFAFRIDCLQDHVKSP